VYGENTSKFSAGLRGLAAGSLNEFSDLCGFHGQGRASLKSTGQASGSRRFCGRDCGNKKIEFQRLKSTLKNMSPFIAALGIGKP